MSVAPSKSRMTREQFFAWAEEDGGLWEYDGWEPVPMNGGTFNHSLICRNMVAALLARLLGTRCQPFGNAGLATIHGAVRYPDALVTCSEVDGNAHLVPGVVVVFEVVSRTSGRTDRITKLREYRSVASIRRYVIVERTFVGCTMFSRAEADAEWTATALTAEDTLHMPEIGADIPLAEFYQDVSFPPESE